MMKCNWYACECEIKSPAIVRVMTSGKAYDVCEDALRTLHKPLVLALYTKEASK